jgi:tungstate transport system ATP-binding protein
MNEWPVYRLDRIKRIIDEEKVILDIESLSLPQGELTAIVGPNGAGKSTLLNILAFLDTPEQGTVHYRGEPVEAKDFFRYRRQVTMVDQTPLLFRGTVLQNVAYGLKVRGIPRAQWARRVDEALALVDLGGFENRSVVGLSGGETQRVAIARAMVFHPQVILLDEPTAGVDVARMEMVESLITELHSAMGVSIIFSTHNLAQAFRLTDGVIHLAGGKTVPSSVDNLFSGQARPHGDACVVHLSSGVALRISSVHSGSARLAVPAASVVVEPFSISTEEANQFDGIIARMELRGSTVRLLVSGRQNFRAEMSLEEMRRKDLRLGGRVAVIIPPDAIQLLRG